MRQPLWAINSSLLLLFFIGQLVFFVLYSPIPRRFSLEPQVVVDKEKATVVVTLQNIYEQNDLFGTYVPSFVDTAAKEAEPVIPIIPEAPATIPLHIPVEPEKIFIAPLAVTLKGIMYSYENPEKSVAIIQFQDSKEEMNYRVGQLINDAQIIKMYPNRVLVIRSNGQQETLYLRESEAGKDLALETSRQINNISVVVKNGVYHVPVDTFVQYVKSLGQFIDLLDLTTVYHKGKSVGCRVGKAGKDHLGSKLGFVKDDVVESVDDMPVADIASRVLVFDHVIQKKAGDMITIKINRGGRTVHLKYVLTHTQHVVGNLGATAKSVQSKVAESEHLIYDLDQHRKKMLEQKVKFAPTAHQLENEERRKIFEARRKDLFASRPVQQGVASVSNVATVDSVTLAAKGQS